MDLIKEFKKTRENKQYNSNLITHVYNEIELNNIEYKSADINNLSVVHIDTVRAILSSKGKIAALNFADAYEPGGLVLYGVKTQEEDLCRSSNLYESLTMPVCSNEYYSYNRSSTEFSCGKASDRIIYTENVTFFRDSNLKWLSDEEIRECDIITCPSPIFGTATDDEIRHRMRNILLVATEHNIDNLILGCWGCGAFGNDWEHFKQLWLEVINNTNINYAITFAIMSNTFDEIKER